MAENIQETKPPEPPPKPLEVPKPTEQKPNGSETSAQPQESQHSAQQDARNAASSEHTKATSGPEPEGLRPTAEFQAGLDEHSATKNGPERLRPTPEFQERLDAHTAEKAEPAQEQGVAPRGQDPGVDQHAANSGTPQPAEDVKGVQHSQEEAGAPRSTELGGAHQQGGLGGGNGASPAGVQAGEHAAARQAVTEERAKATPADETAGVPKTSQDHPSVNEETTPRQPAADQTADDQPPVPGDTPNGDESGDSSAGTPDTGYTGPERRQYDARHLDPAADLRDQPPPTPQDDPGTDKSAETAGRLDELRTQGHGPQRHHDPSDAQLVARLGDPVLDPQSGEPVLKDNGGVRAQNQLDPMTDTTVDGDHGGVHRCGNYATRIDSPEDYVAAERYMRNQIGDSGSMAARLPISEVLGPNAHERMTGYYHDPDAQGRVKPVDFAGGTVFALYKRLPNGDLNLRTMYVDPAPSNPDQ